MANSDDCFLYFHVWEGLGPTFPFDRFDSVSDDALEEAVIEMAMAWLQDGPNRLKEYVKQYVVRREDASPEQLAKETKSRMGSIEGFWQIASLAGWRRGSRKERIRTFRQYFHCVEGTECASTVVGVLRADAQSLGLSSIRIGLVRGADLAVIDRVRVRMEVEAVQKSGERSESLGYSLYVRAQRAESHARVEFTATPTPAPLQRADEIATIEVARDWLVTKLRLAKVLGVDGRAWLSDAWPAVRPEPAQPAPAKGGYAPRYKLGELYDSFVAASSPYEIKLPALTLTPSLLKALEHPDSPMPWSKKAPPAKLQKAPRSTPKAPS